jgi:hypothetical protein
MTAPAILDWDRVNRVGITEAVLCEPKTADQLAAVLDQADSAGRSMLLTRLTVAQLATLPADHRARIDYEEVSSTGFFGAPTPIRGPARIAVVTGGTSDIGVAREAVRALLFHGHVAVEIYDVGVAGLWRIQQHLPEIAASSHHRVRRHGRGPAHRACRVGSRPGDRGTDIGGLRRRRRRPHGPAQPAVQLRPGPGGDQHRQRLRRGLRRDAESAAWMTN